MQRPATRAARLSVIEKMLLSHVITSQSQLSGLLSDEGIDVTQATLSRDLDEINAMKTRLADGTIAYTVGDHPGRETAETGISTKMEQQMSRVLSGLVTSVAAAKNLIVVHTPSGAAQYVASVIDKQPIDGVLGTIAGDDTVMIVCRDDELAEARADWLLAVASK
ncbi:arginine repressor [Bifidobacterium leontopitheci]|uniref:Arginine repressor n=1 Tax=Bifidobacterium leontopitheci TaxID=2650774 RepID=A0A6I1GN03_9BIFI|nr:arginine repressor [Bifidobacterium leontopitheci]